MHISQGQRIPLSSLLPGQAFTLSIHIPSPPMMDFVCFGLDAQGQLSDDCYMIFFNQPNTPCHSVTMPKNGEFTINLAGLPPSIERLAFTAAIDGPGVMRDLQASQFNIQTPTGEVVGSGMFSGDLFAEEKAIMVAKLYRKQGAWRFASNLQGFNAGLDALVRHFGGEVSHEPHPTPMPPVSPPKVSLEKKIAEAAPHLVSLAKKAQVSLEKAQLTEVQARVILVLDASGSMNSQYAKGRVQEVVNRLLPLAVHFDDDGALECWAFAAKPQKLTPVTLANHKNFIDTDSDGWRKWNVGQRINNEPKVIEQVIEHCAASKERTPTYVLFISDRGIQENRTITRLMIEAAHLPIFWQYVGIGGHGYGILEQLDTLSGRIVDNCGFFALDDLHNMSEEQLYDRLMEDFPLWIKAATTQSTLP